MFDSCRGHERGHMFKDLIVREIIDKRYCTTLKSGVSCIHSLLTAVYLPVGR